MEVFAFIGGITAKIYDDIIDNNIQINPIILESLKGLQWMSLTALSINDFNFNILFLALVSLNYFFDKDAYSTPYEKSFPVLLVPLLTNFNTVKPFVLLDFGLFLGISSGLFIDSILFKNIEIDISKCIFRMILAFLAMISFCILKYSKFHSTMMIVFLYFISYTITSSLFQMYILFNPSSSIPQFLPPVPKYVHEVHQSTCSGSAQ